MAIYNEILAGRFARGIQKIFSMKGGVPTRQLSGEVMATFELDKATALENRIIHSVRSFSYSKTVAAGGVGANAGIRLRNPAASNMVVTIEKVTFAMALADNPQINRGPTGTGDLGNVDSGNESIRDLRLGPAVGALIASFATATGALVGTRWLQVQGAANSTVDCVLTQNQEFVVAPGDLITIYAGVQNQAISATVFWRERTLEESEVTA